MWIMIAIISFKVIIQKNQSEDRRILVILMLSGLAAFATDCMFSFPAERIEHSLYITLMSGIILGSYSNQVIEKERRRTLYRWLFLAMLFIVAFNLFIGIKQNSFVTHMNLAMAFDKENRYQDVIDESDDGKHNFAPIHKDGKPREIYSVVSFKELKNYNNSLTEINT